LTGGCGARSSESVPAGRGRPVHVGADQARPRGTRRSAPGARGRHRGVRHDRPRLV